MLRTVNRLLLGLGGLTLFALGGAALVGGFGLERHWGFRLPGWWPFGGPEDVILTDGARTRFRDDGWWWPVVLVALGVLLALLLWWLLSQLRRNRLAAAPVDTGDGVGGHLRGRALEDAMAAEAEAMDGVARARVRLTGRPAAPRTRAGLRLEAHAQPANALERLSREALRHARESAGVGSLPAEVRLHAVRHRARRVT